MISIQKEILKPLSGRFLPDNSIELVILKDYSFKRNNGLDYTEVLITKLKEHMIKDNGEDFLEFDIHSVFSKNQILNVTYKLLEYLDIMLLEKITDVNFIDIIYKNEDELNLYFEVLYGDNKRV